MKYTCTYGASIEVDPSRPLERALLDQFVSFHAKHLPQPPAFIVDQGLLDRSDAVICKLSPELVRSIIGGEDLESYRQQLSPFEVEILLRYFYDPTYNAIVKRPCEAVENAVAKFCRGGVLDRRPNYERIGDYRLTKKGQEWVRRILRVRCPTGETE